MKQISSITLAAMLTLLILGCGKKEPDITLKEPEFKKYPFKSAVIEYTFSGDGSGTMKHYIDYWGAREVQEDKSAIKMMGQERKNNMLVISDQDTAYQIDMDKKEGMKMKDPRWDQMIQQFKSAKPEEKENFAGAMMKKSMQQFQAKSLGTEEVLGKKCDIMEMQGYKISLWNGLPLKSVVEMQGMKMTVLATKLETDVDIPSNLFIPPDGIKWQTMPQQGVPPQQQQQQSDPHASQDPHSSAPTGK